MHSATPKIIKKTIAPPYRLNAYGHVFAIDSEFYRVNSIQLWRNKTKTMVNFDKSIREKMLLKKVTTQEYFTWRAKKD